MFLKIIGMFFLKNILTIHTGAMLAKLKASLYISLAISPFAFLIEKCTQWYLTNEAYVLWVSWAIFVDLVIGLIYHLFKKKDFSWMLLGKGLLIKIGMAVLAGSLFEALPHFLKQDSFVAEGLLLVTRLSVFMYPAASAWMNASAITDGKFPPIGWTKKLKAFNENLELKSLKDND